MTDKIIKTFLLDEQSGTFHIQHSDNSTTRFDANDIAVLKRDSSGNLEGIQTVNGEDIATSSSGGVFTAENTLCLSGDSRLAFGAINDVEGDPIGYNSCSQVMWMNDHLAAFNRMGFDLITNAAQGGETLASAVVNGNWAKALASPAKFCIMMYMHNDLNPFGLVDDTVESFLTKYEAALVQMMATKDCVFVFSGTPLVSSASTEMNKTWYRFIAANTGLKRLCAKYPKAVYVDQYSAVLDQTSNTLDPIEGTIQTDDGVHLTTKGAQIMGHSAASQIADKVLLTRYRTKGANLLPAWTGTGGTKSGTFVCTTNNNLPANWEIRLESGGSSASEVVISVVDGGIRRLVFTNSAGTEAKFQVRIGATGRANLTSAVALDDIIQGAFGYQLFENAGANLGGFVRANSSNSFVTVMGGKSSNEQVLVVPTVGVSGVRMSTPFRLKTAPTNMEFVIEVIVPATTGACTLDIWNPEVYKLV